MTKQGTLRRPPEAANLDFGSDGLDRVVLGNSATGQPDRTVVAEPFRPSIVVHRTSEGDDATSEIARSFVEGFHRLGYSASMAVDEIPSIVPTRIEFNLVVGPHEFFPLFLAKRVRRGPLRAIASNCFCLNTEPVGTNDFEAGLEFASCCKGLFDISDSGARELSRRGLMVTYAPMAYSPTPPGTSSETRHAGRPIDILFLGHYSKRRARFLARYADILSRFNCRLLLWDEQTRRCERLGGLSPKSLLKDSKILVNWHTRDGGHVAWHYAFWAMESGCLFVSEPTSERSCYEAGVHWVAAESDHVMERCLEYLHDESARLAITDRAYQLVTTQLTAETGCRVILSTLEADRALQNEVQRPPKRSARHRIAFNLDRLRQLPRTCEQFLRRRQIVHRLYNSFLSTEQRLRGYWSLNEILDRRKRVIERLNQSEEARSRGKLPAHEFRPNSLWDCASKPAVSVVVTVYNYERFIGRCLTSVARSDCSQLPDGVEIVVVDDASIDQSRQVAHDVIEQLQMPGCVVAKSLNTGLADSRNLGVHFARAPLIFMLDADNFIYPNCLATLAQTLRASNADAVYGTLQKIDGRTLQGFDLLSCFPWDPNRLVRCPYIDAMAMFRREKLMAVGGYSLELIRHGWFGWEDYDLWLKFAQAGYSCQHCAEIVAAYRVHPSSMIQVTRHFAQPLSDYFHVKFADLVARQPDSLYYFGFPRPRRH